VAYLTAAQLGIRHGYRELAEVAAPDQDAALDPDSFETCVGGGACTAGETEAKARVTQACDDASSFADSFIATAGYTVPLTTAPDALVVAVADIARYYLHGDAPTETIRKRYEDARAWLDRVAAGKVTLDGAEASGTTGAVPTIDAPDQLFDSDTMDAFVGL